MDDLGEIALTDKGLEIAQSIYERHEIIASLLISIGVDKETAYEDSCKIEHVISSQTFDKLKELINKQK